ncbi:TPA: hypothetical protein IAC10_00475 [Candidatus Scatousia excrementigallinarum]|uniref:N-acetyltransferase domain-containing protein n=1 Tax=Candidatus Scatousia excrementigallinarum TaxID=2840935 RepID=A0A9D1EXE6_9BACT|nr:hypothetical protein [Candidatus Scatousia excrementigallinarum]
MTRIRRLSCLDIPKISKMIEYLDNNENIKFTDDLRNEAFTMLHTMLPLKYKFLPESYVLSDKKEILGLITIVPTMGNPYKINISRLIFGNNYYDAGKQLVEFVIARYGSKGATSFCVTVDESHDELLQLFSQGCGFRHCACECLWKVENFNFKNIYPAPFRPCQNSDAKQVSRLFNSELKSLFRPSLERDKNEYKEPFFEGFTNFYKNRYVLEEPQKKRIIAYLSVTTTDNLNFIIDISTNDGYNLSYDEILYFALKEISSRKSSFYAFVRQKKYTKTSENFEEYLNSRGFKCIQTQHVMIKDFYKPVKAAENVLQVFLFGNNRVSAN